MKIKIPYVIVTCIKGREVNDIVFLDTSSCKMCADIVKASNGIRVLNTTVKRCELEVAYEDVTPEVIFTVVCAQSGANMAWDDTISRYVDIPAESAGVSND